MHRTTRVFLIIVLAAAVAVLALESRWTGAGTPEPASAARATQQEGAPPLPEFQPSEQLPADAAVAFPADI